MGDSSASVNTFATALVYCEAEIEISPLAAAALASSFLLATFNLAASKFLSKGAMAATLYGQQCRRHIFALW
jgi:hypothetical protein